MALEMFFNDCYNWELRNYVTILKYSYLCPFTAYIAFLKSIGSLVCRHKYFILFDFVFDPTV